MIRYVGRRLAFSIVVVVGVVVMTFVIARVVPADPARLHAGGLRASQAQVEQARRELGLDKPLHEQFVAYVGSILLGDFGTSFTTRRAVSEDLAQFLPATLELVFPAMALGLMIGVPMGVVSGARRGGKLDRAIAFASISGAALPAFWLALVGQLLLGGRLLPVGGRLGTDTTINNPISQITGFNTVDALITGNLAGLLDASAHLVLPVAVLAVYPISLVIRQTRAAVTEVLAEPYVVAARAAGISERTILFRLVLKNAIVPTLNVLGLTFASSLTGTVLIEIVFAWPGIGRYVTIAITGGDFPAVIAVAIIGAFGYVVVNLLVDIVQAVLDPRIRLT